MNSENRSSGLSSAGTSPSERPDPSSQREYLAQQTEQARAAIQQTIAAIQQSLRDSADLKAWAQQYPWATVGVAAASGFAATAMVLQAGGDRHANEPPAAEAASRESRGGGIWEPITSALADVLKTVLQSTVLAAVAAKAQQPSENGHDVPQEA
jgi:ElaB/YqjD/DUF883 family membrane-anchored ribosome-binding protein